jgi:hypothetical protein
MAEYSVVGVYNTLGEAEDVVRSLGDGGFPLGQVSVIAQPVKGDRRVHGYVTSWDVARSAATTGAWLGGTFGLLVGATFLWVPGVGPLVVAGLLAAALVGGIEGAVVGAAATGLFGWLVSLGIAREKIRKYEQAVRAGKFLVIAHGTPEAVTKAREILTGSPAEQLDQHTPALAT